MKSIREQARSISSLDCILNEFSEETDLGFSRDKDQYPEKRPLLFLRSVLIMQERVSKSCAGACTTGGPAP